MRTLFGVGVLGACSVLLASCTEAVSPKIDVVEVSRNATDAVEITWKTDRDRAPIDVYGAARADAPEGERVLISNDNVTGTLVVAAEAKRRFYFVANQNQSGVWAAERVLPLQGGRNFRDLGGYKTVDGKSVKWGKLYRSGTMVGLTDADYTYLSSLGIQQICDFRSTSERKAEPTTWKAGSAVVYTARDYEDATSGELGAVLAKPNATGADVAAAMTNLYHGMTERFADQYADMFDRLVKGQAPLAFNCSAGKDRTGIAAALVLTALGVPRETGLADYALSDKIVNYEEAFTGKDAKPIDGPYAFIARLPAEVRAPLLKSDPAYLSAALAKIEAQYGSINAYLEKRLGVDANEVQTLRSLYLS
jgi:protein-tyrosine phosphatase